MLRLACSLAVVILAVAINVSALQAGEDRRGWLYFTASACGALGIFFMLCIPISLIYALISYLFSSARDPGMLLNVAWIGTGICTLFSSALCMGIWRSESRFAAP